MFLLRKYWKTRKPLVVERTSFFTPLEIEDGSYSIMEKGEITSVETFLSKVEDKVPTEDGSKENQETPMLISSENSSKSGISETLSQTTRTPITNTIFDEHGYYWKFMEE